MVETAGGLFDPLIFILMWGAVGRAVDSLSLHEQTERNKTLIANAIVHAAARGERDPGQLFELALNAVRFGGRDAAMRH